MSSSKNNRKLIFSLMSAGFIGSLSQNMTVSALPAILAFFHTNTVSGQWLTNIFILILGITTATSACLFSRFPTRKLVLTTLSIFIGGCILSLLSQSFSILLLSRIIQGLGSGVLIPLLQISLLHLFPEEKQGQALGITGIIIGFAPAAGITLAGILVDFSGWRSIFWFLLFLASGSFLLGFFSLREIGERHPASFDFLSVFLYSSGIILLMVSITFLKKHTMSPWLLLFLSVLGIFFLFCFTKRQWSMEFPLLKLRLFQYVSVRKGVVLFLLSFTIMMCGTTLFPLYIQTICRYSATFSGLLCLPGSVMIAIASPISGRLIDRFNPEFISVAGSILLTTGTLPFLLFSENSNMILVCITYTLQCTGIAILLTAALCMGVSKIPMADKVHSTAILNSFRQVFGSLLATTVIVFVSVISEPSDLNIRGIHAAFLILTITASTILFYSIYNHCRFLKQSSC